MATLVQEGRSRFCKANLGRRAVDQGGSQQALFGQAMHIPVSNQNPGTRSAIFHRIVVAHDAARACAEALGGSGSLMIRSDLDKFSFSSSIHNRSIESSKGYAHVFDDTSLNIVMSTLDTITDFVTYLTKKERFLTGKKVIAAAGEEELLAIYLRGMNAKGERDFTIEGENDRDYDTITLEEGFWEAFARNHQRLAQIESDKISYSWDELVEKFSFYAMAGTQYHTTGRPLRTRSCVQVSGKRV